MHKETRYFQLKPFRERLKNVRVETGYTQLEIAEKLDIGITQWLNFEKDNYFISLDKLAHFTHLIRERNIPYSDLNYLILSDPPGEWKKVRVHTLDPTRDNDGDNMHHLLEENKKLKSQNSKLIDQHLMLLEQNQKLREKLGII